jgi:uncharacterized protein
LVSGLIDFPLVAQNRSIEMNGTYLRFYMHENAKHRHLMQYEWLLQHAKRLGVHGGSAFRAIEGFGRHGVLNSHHFFELGGTLTIEVEFVLTDDIADRLLASLDQENVNIVYARCPAQFGVAGARKESVHGGISSNRTVTGAEQPPL